MTPPLLLFSLILMAQPSEKEVKMTLWRNGTLADWSVGGTVYWDKEFKKGFALLNGHKNKELLLRYDAYSDEIEYLDDEDKRMLFQRSEYMGAIIDSITYRYIDYLDGGEKKSGFFNPLNEGETILYLRNTKTIFYKAPENGYESFIPPKFIQNTSYYLKRKDRPAMPLNDLSKKEIFAVLWEHYADLRTYARENKLRMRTVEEVIQVLNYYDSLPQK
ncbi:hypothetical protein [Ulvibacterium sp.]|uniref:hypothetical protein n=1 Tax=Ulvibacterium sp. TaxID=2665914 RepID=UPI0026276232|nr:hypothetical protein [Ulvibacterium sp.]